MIHQEKDGHHVADGACFDVNVHIGRRVVENTPVTPVHWPPHNGWTVGIGAAGRVEAKLATKLIRRIGRTPGDAGAIACAGCDLYLCKDARLEGSAAVVHFQAGRPPKGVCATCRSLDNIGDIPRKDEGIPAIGQLARWAALWVFHVTHRLWDDIGRVALIRGASRERQAHQKRQREKCRCKGLFEGWRWLRPSGDGLVVVEMSKKTLSVLTAELKDHSDEYTCNLMRSKT